MFIPTLKEAPADAQVASHRLLVRAGFIRQLGAGIYDHLPLARRSLAKVERIVREEMDAIGGQEFHLPALHPAEVWKESGRWEVMGDNMFRLKDRKGADYCLGMTHEEIFAAIARDELRSYRQLPQVWYQIQTKFRDEPRPKSGLLRVRQFTMKDAYSFDVDAGRARPELRRPAQGLREDLHALRPRLRGRAGPFRRHGRLRVAGVHGPHRRRRGRRGRLPEVPLRRQHRDGAEPRAGPPGGCRRAARRAPEVPHAGRPHHRGAGAAAARALRRPAAEDPGLRRRREARAGRGPRRRRARRGQAPDRHRGGAGPARPPRGDPPAARCGRRLAGRGWRAGRPGPRRRDPGRGRRDGDRRQRERRPPGGRGREAGHPRGPGSPTCAR